MFEKIKKRDGRVVQFDAEKITAAIKKAGQSSGEFGEEAARKLTLRVLNLAQQAIPHKIPTVEEIQDIVEEILLSSSYRKTAKAYILYREQHAKIREISNKVSVELVDQYLDKIDWQIKENSNMAYSLQGLNNYISSETSKIYWLDKIYPPEIRQAHTNGDFHIHDLNILSVYCVGWDLQDLLLEGFKGAPGKVESGPARHLRSALGQVVNFFYTLQGEAAGAQAFSNLDTLLCPFIRYDRLEYKEVRQALQEFIFNINVPTRVGFQCISEDTEILTIDGWKGYKEIKRGDLIKTFNLNTGEIENEKVISVFKKFYKGLMYNLKNRIQDQLISPGHRVVRKKFNANRYVLEPIEEIIKLKSPFIIPVAGENNKIKESYIQKIEKVDYNGIIWCPHTKNETVIARRNGKAFITGNTPFTNVTLDLTVPRYFADQPVLIGGKPQAETYGEFGKEMEMFDRAFLEVMSAGDAKSRVFTFPIPTFNITKDFDWENKNLDFLWEGTAKYGYPYFSNFINSDMDPGDARSMCCRLRIDNRQLEKRGGGLFGAHPLTGSIGVVTINMVLLGYTAKDEEAFIKRLEHLMVLAKESLEIKRKILEKFTEVDLYAYSKFYLRNVKKRLGEYWKNHFSTIGLIGMNEACLNLFGENIASSRGCSFALTVLEFMRNKLLEFQEETGNNYNLEATPAEGTSYRLARIDKAKYPELICANESEYKKGAQPFYTNSTQLPVNLTDDIFEALDLQDSIQTRYTGGTVFHIFAGERIQNYEGLKALTRKICENYHLPYFTFTPTFSICPSHGYIAGEHSLCPQCSTACEVYSRVVGYLRPVNQWNEGKQEEFKIRKTFAITK